jgi:lipid-A-disaccharide synthase
LAERDATLRFTLPVADDRFRATLEREIRARRLDRLVAVHDRSLTPMQAADLVLVSSGTATLEAMLLQLPMIVAYRMSTSSYWIVRGLLRAGVIRDRFMSMPNLVLGRPVVPEFLQSRMTAAALAAEARRILSSSDAQSAQRSAYREGVARLAGGHSVERVAEAVLAAAERRHT